MKFGILNYNNKINNFFSSFDSAIVNIGDYIQSYGIESAYNYYMQKAETKYDLKFIEKEKLSTYKGEKIIVPLNNVFADGGLNGSVCWFPTSPDIIPIFIGFNCHDEFLIEKNCEFLKKWSPIGCRDEKTKQLCEKQRIPAYISGCSSILQNKRINEKGKKVFLVDVSEKLLPYIPKELIDRSEILSHNLYVKDYCEEFDYGYENLLFWNIGKNYINKYKKEAQLVITSKLHCAVPCIAMGIPVVLAKDNIDYRFSWIDKFIPLYSEDDYPYIDWNPPVINIENVKNTLFAIYFKIINNIISETSNYISEIDEINAYYMNRTRSIYNQNTVKDLKNILKENVNYRVLIWGAGRTGGLFCEVLMNNFVNVTIVGFLDSIKRGTYKGYPIFAPETLKENYIEDYSYNYIFLCSLPGRKVAIKKMDILKKRKGRDYMECYFEDTKLGG